MNPVIAWWFATATSVSASSRPEPGPLSVKKPRVNDRREGVRFTSSLPAAVSTPLTYDRRANPGALPEGPFRRVTSVRRSRRFWVKERVIFRRRRLPRLKQQWIDEYRDWNQRSLKNKHYVYLWADGIYFNVRLSADRPCMLVLMGADGRRQEGADRTLSTASARAHSRGKSYSWT